MSSTAKWPHQNNHTKRPGPCDGGPEKSFLVGEWEGVVVLRLQASFSSLQSHTLKALTVLLPAGQVETKIKTPIMGSRLLRGFHLRNKSPVFNINYIKKKICPRSNVWKPPQTESHGQEIWVGVLPKVGFFAEQAEVSEKCCRTCGGFWKVLQERSSLALFKVWIHFSIVSSFLSFSGCRGRDAHSSPFLWHVLMKPCLPVFWDYRGGFNPCCLHPGLWAELVDSLPSTPQSCEHSRWPVLPFCQPQRLSSILFLF